MNKDEIENLFDDEELEDKNNKEIENDITNKLEDKNTDESEKKDIYGLENKEEYMKDPSLDDVFPDKNDVDIDRLLNKFEEETKEYDDSDDSEYNDIFIDTSKPSRIKLGFEMEEGMGYNFEPTNYYPDYDDEEIEF